MKIYKYPLMCRNQIDTGNAAMATLPQGYEILSTGFDFKGHLCVWAKVSAPAPGVTGPTESVVFEVVGTGFDAPDDATFIGTVLADPYVWHVFRHNAKVQGTA